MVAGNRTIDLNSDVGESFGRWQLGDDEAVLDIVTSANVACGFHAGDPTWIARACRAAVARGISIGAHVAYRDLAGFGRRFVDATPGELADDCVYQIGALSALAAREGGRVEYVKPHGALYNTIVAHEAHARAVVDAVRGVDPNLPLVVLPGSVIERVARGAGLRTVAEMFADRAYAPDGSLVPRSAAGSVLAAREAAEQVGRFVTEGTIRAQNGDIVRVAADTVCVHGDSPGAVAMSAAVREALAAAGVGVAPFVRSAPTDARPPDDRGPTTDARPSDHRRERGTP